MSNEKTLTSGSTTGVQHTDCRSQSGIATGLVDSIITSIRVLYRHYPDIPKEVLSDLAQDPEFKWLSEKMNAQGHSS